MSRRRGVTFGAVVVTVAFDEHGAPWGSEIRCGGLRWRVDAWPYRLARVRPEGDGLAVEFRGGSSRLLGIEDAEPESEVAA